MAMTVLGMECFDWLKVSSPPPEMCRLPGEDENLKGNADAVTKRIGLEWTLELTFNNIHYTREMICSQGKKKGRDSVCHKIFFQYLPRLLNLPTQLGAQTDNYIYL